MRYLYIHGFNSNAQSRSGGDLERILQEPVTRLDMDYSQNFRQCLAHLEAQVEKLAPEGGLCVMGSSLGGYYAMQLRHLAIDRVITWNPVVFPALQLAPFVGKNVRFTDNTEWQFSADALLSYAQADDPRFWETGLWREGGRPPRFAIIGLRDEVLNPQLALAFWDKPEYGIKVNTLDCGHSVPDYEESLRWALADPGI